MKKVFIIFISLFVFLSCKTTSRSNNILYKIKIEKGDTLSAIARKYDTTAEKIVDLNSLKSPIVIKVGQIILLAPGPLGLVAKSNRLNKKSLVKNKSSGFLFGGSKKIIWPVNGRVTSEYGMRRGRPHDGVDISASRGTPIKSVTSGRVKSSGWIRGYGKTVVITHDRFETLYAHCSVLKVKRGQRVSRGQIIGLIGSTGNASGAHLHFEYRNLKSAPMNPRLILKPRLLSKR